MTGQLHILDWIQAPRVLAQQEPAIPVRHQPRLPTKKRGPRVLIAILLAVLPLAGCFEDPIEDRLAVDLTAASDGLRARVELERTIRRNRGRGTAFDRRLRAVEQATLDGTDPLFATFDSAFRRRLATDDGGSWERSDGRLERAERWFESRQPLEALRTVLDSGAVTTRLEVLGDRVELDIVPLPGARRARRGERQAFDRLFDRWVRDYAAYLETIDDLWRRLDERPQLTAATMVRLFGEMSDEELLAAVESGEAPATALEPLPDPIHATLERLDLLEELLLKAFEADDDSHSLQELARLIYDPLPAQLVVSGPGEVLEHGGFVLPGENDDYGSDTVLTRHSDLLTAWRGTKDLWLSPNPLMLEIEALVGDDEPELDDLLAMPRRRLADGLTATEIRQRIEQALRGPEKWWVTWEQPEN